MNTTTKLPIGIHYTADNRKIVKIGESSQTERGINRVKIMFIHFYAK